MKLKAVILAAGYATRLYPLTLDIPKCLLTVGKKTILDILCGKLDSLERLDEIIVVTNAKFFEQLERWKSTAKMRVPIRVLNDLTLSNETRLGAVGDLNFALGTLVLRSDILLLASDNLFDDGLNGFLNFSKTKKEAVSIALYDIHDPASAANKFSVHELGAGSEVIRMEEKPARPSSSLIGMGVYYFPESTLHFVKEYLGQKNAQDAPGYYVRWLLGKTKIYGFLFSGLWYDIGDFNALDEAKKIFGGEKNP